jgi:hypothetical protein
MFISIVNSRIINWLQLHHLGVSIRHLSSSDNRVLDLVRTFLVNNKYTLRNLTLKMKANRRQTVSFPHGFSRYPVPRIMIIYPLLFLRVQNQFTLLADKSYNTSNRLPFLVQMLRVICHSLVEMDVWGRKVEITLDFLLFKTQITIIHKILLSHSLQWVILLCYQEDPRVERKFLITVLMIKTKTNNHSVSITHQ